jgi:predicted unusual protein kinase regulating ubiquinone biosynthesis (AarF/ABC1/UbiB family)
MAGPPTSRIVRLGRLGTLAGRVSGSYLARTVAGTLQDEDLRKAALGRLHIENAERIVETMSALKGAAMKLGQSIAQAASGLDLPPEVGRILGRLNAHAEPVPYETIREDIEKSLGRPVTEIFSWIDPQALGSASLGQAHRATLPDGSDVVVKVLYRDIDKSVASDLMALKAILRAGSVIRRPREEVDALFDEVRDRLTEELDYIHEAANITLFTDQLGADERIRLPTVHPEVSTKNVLVMDRLPGVPLETFLATAGPEARQRAGETMGDVLFRMVYRHFVLHADPHPGNYLFEPDGRVGLLDFGCVKRFKPDWTATYADVGLAAMELRREDCLEGCRRMGVLIGESAEAEELLWEFCSLIALPFRSGRYTVGGHADSILERLGPVSRKILHHPEIRVDRELLYMNRALAGTYTILRRLVVRADWGEIFASHARVGAAHAGLDAAD